MRSILALFLWKLTHAYLWCKVLTPDQRPSWYSRWEVMPEGSSWMSSLGSCLWVGPLDKEKSCPRSPRALFLSLSFPSCVVHRRRGSWAPSCTGLFCITQMSGIGGNLLWTLVGSIQGSYKSPSQCCQESCCYNNKKEQLLPPGLLFQKLITAWALIDPPTSEVSLNLHKWKTGMVSSKIHWYFIYEDYT